MDGKTKIIIMVVVFIVSMALIFIGQKKCWLYRISD